MTVPPLSRIIALPDDATLGEIAWAWNGENPRLPSLSTEFNDLKAREYDARFGYRLDYQMWRKFERDDFALPPGEQWASCEAIEEFLGSNDNFFTVIPVVYLLSCILTGRRRREAFQQSEIDRLFAVLELGVDRPVTIADGFGPPAAFAQLLARSAVLGHRTALYKQPLEVDAALGYLRKVITLLQEIDDRWRLGHALRDRALASPRPVLPKVKVSLLRQVLFALDNCHRLAVSVVKSQTTLTDAVDELTQNDAYLALTYWNTARTLVMGETRFRADKRPGSFVLDLEQLVLEQERSLRNVVSAMHDAGWHLPAAALGHVLLRVWKQPESKKPVNYIARFVHQAGFEADDKFQPGPKDKITKLRRDTRPYWWRIRHDQEKVVEWQELLSLYPVWKKSLHVKGDQDPSPLAYDPYHLIRDLAHDSGELQDTRVFRSAFQLALRYRWNSLAAKLLPRFRPSKRDLLDFVQQLKRSQQIMPFALDGELHARWATTIRKCWRGFDDIALNEDESLVVSEVLLGRGTQILRCPTIRDVTVFAQKYNRLLNEDDAGQAYWNNPGVSGLGRPQLTRRTCIGF